MGATFARKSADGQYIWAVNFDSLATLSVEGMVVDGDDNIWLQEGFTAQRIWLPVLQSTWFRQHKLMYSLPSIAGRMGIWFVQKRLVPLSRIILVQYVATGTKHFAYGFFYSPINVDPNGSYILTTGGFADIYVAKYDSTGQLITAAQISSASGDQSSVLSLIIAMLFM